MTIFALPDLGEGLPDAEIHEWFVNEGDEVVAYQPLVSMETAKALVDVPCPQSGKILKCYGKPGDIIKTGSPLIEFAIIDSSKIDQGTVVGHLEESSEQREDSFTVGTTSHTIPKATPKARLLAKKMHVELNGIPASGEYGVITEKDVAHVTSSISEDGFEPLRGVRRAMQISMSRSHQHIVPVSLFDEVDIHFWEKGTDITLRLMRAIQAACMLEPALNAWFDQQKSAVKRFTEVNIGLAMDHDDGLFVPVITDIANKSDLEIREWINNCKVSVANRSLTSEQLKGATFTLSNFGKFSGRFASPIIVPPTVAILAVGSLYTGAIVTPEGNVAAHRLLPLSLSFDHRAITGGEATRFLSALMQSLTLSQ